MAQSAQQSAFLKAFVTKALGIDFVLTALTVAIAKFRADEYNIIN
ncbi:MAG TPA: hypothetical protein V6D15_19115 [Oculatellaceae cyanobacterium]|jgi:hypothetical protein